MNILIIQTAFIGDVILSTPLIRETRKLFPNANIDVLVIPQTAALLQNNPHIRHIFTFDKRQRSQKIKAFLQTLKKIRTHNYDVALIPHKSWTTAQLAFLGGIRRRVGFSERSASMLYTDRVFFDKRKRQIERYLDLLSVFSHRSSDIQTELFFNKQQIQQATDIKQRYATMPKIAVAPGSVWPTKRWPEEKFVELLKRLDDSKTAFIFIGSPVERELCQQIMDRSDISIAENVASATGLLEAAAVIQGCDLLLCNDSGTMHMANAVKTDVVAFFGPTVERYGFAPFRSEDKVFQVDLSCRPCSLHGSTECPLGHFKCMLDIDVESVARYIQNHLKQKPG